MDILGPADKADGRHAETMAVQRILGRPDHFGVGGEPQVVVRAEVQHLLPGRDPDDRALGGGDDALFLKEARFADVF